MRLSHHLFGGTRGGRSAGYLVRGWQGGGGSQSSASREMKEGGGEKERRCGLLSLCVLNRVARVVMAAFGHDAAFSEIRSVTLCWEVLAFPHTHTGNAHKIKREHQSFVAKL